MNTLNLVTLSLITYMLTGCSSTQKLMPTPNIYTDIGSYPESSVPAGLKSNKVDLLYVTDRAPDATDNGTLEYGTKRSASVGFGSAIVEIGDDLTWQELVEISEKSSRSTSPAIQVTSRTERGESLLLRKLILGIQAQVRSKSLTGLIKICDALIRPASTYKNPRGVFI